jgi:hypothetical protein
LGEDKEIRKNDTVVTYTKLCVDRETGPGIAVGFLGDYG